MNNNTFPTDEELGSLKGHDLMLYKLPPSNEKELLESFEDEFESLRSKYNMSRESLWDLLK